MAKKLERSFKNLTVRPLRTSDYRSWKRAYLGLQPKKRNSWDIPARSEDELTKDEFLRILKSQKENRDKDYFFDFGIFLKDGSLVGGVALMDISRQVFQNAYLGYRIFNTHWGKGYGTIAVRLAIEIGFQDLNLHRIEAGIAPRNKRSIALAKSLGLRREGLSRKRLLIAGEWVDISIYAMTAEDFGVIWKPRKS